MEFYGIVDPSSIHITGLREERYLTRFSCVSYSKLQGQLPVMSRRNLKADCISPQEAFFSAGQMQGVRNFPCHFCDVKSARLYLLYFSSMESLVSDRDYHTTLAKIADLL